MHRQLYSIELFTDYFIFQCLLYDSTFFKNFCTVLTCSHIILFHFFFQGVVVCYRWRGTGSTSIWGTPSRSLSPTPPSRVRGDAWRTWGASTSWRTRSTGRSAGGAWPSSENTRTCSSTEKVSICPTLQMKGRWESKINVWVPFMYSQKWNCYFQNRIIMFSLSSYTHISVRDLYISRTILSILLPGNMWTDPGNI